MRRALTGATLALLVGFGVWTALAVHDHNSGGRSRPGTDSDAANDKGHLERSTKVTRSRTNVADMSRRPSSATSQRRLHVERTRPGFADLFTPHAGSPRVVQPTHGEGAPEGDWDEVTAAKRVDRALGRYQDALDAARSASNEAERDRRRELALFELSSVRADMFEVDGNLDRYVTLQEAIDD